MLHAGQPPPFADRLVQGVARRGSAEGIAVTGTEPLDAFVVEQRLRRGQQREAVDAPGGTLIGGIEGADAFDLVAEEVEPQRLFLAAGEQVDQPAAHRELALIVDGIGADITVGLQQQREPVQPDPLARTQAGDQLPDAERCQRALRRGGDGGEDELRPLRRRLKPVQRADPLRHDAQGRRGAVIGQAVPARQLDHLQLGREPRRGGRDGAHLRLVRCDEDGARGRGAG